MFVQVELNRLPCGLEGVRKSHDRSVTLYHRPLAASSELLEGGQSTAGLGEPSGQPLHRRPSRSTLDRISGEAALRSTMSTSYGIALSSRRSRSSARRADGRTRTASIATSMSLDWRSRPVPTTQRMRWRSRSVTQISRQSAVCSPQKFSFCRLPTADCRLPTRGIRLSPQNGSS